MILEGKTAIITGPGMGIGRATAVRFAREGAHLTLVDINESALAGVEAECGGLGARVLAVVTDASDLAAIDKFVTATVEAFGGIDILVNNAVFRATKPFLQIEPEEFRRTLEVNVAGYFFLTQKVVPHMIKKGGGRVINISSQLGFVGAKNLSAYCTSKGAVVNMTRTLALELADHNIRVNAVAPGPIDTEGLRKAFEANPDLLASRLADVPMGRLGTPEEIAGVCLFLATDVSSFITGQNLVADGGFLTH